jgi:hypothetical protein
MKLTFAVLALLCLSSAVSASSNAADFKLPLAGLLANHSHPLAEANITVGGDCKQLACFAKLQTFLQQQSAEGGLKWLSECLQAATSYICNCSSSRSSSSSSLQTAAAFQQL